MPKGGTQSSFVFRHSQISKNGYLECYPNVKAQQGSCSPHDALCQWCRLLPGSCRDIKAQHLYSSFKDLTLSSYLYSNYTMAEPKGASDPRLYSSNQPYPVQVIQPYNASARRPTYKRFLYAFALAGLLWFAGATFFRSVAHSVPWVSRLRFGPFIVLMTS